VHKIIFILLLFLFPVFTFAQHAVVITVSDTITSEKIFGAVIVKDGKGIGTTDENGKCTIHLDSAATVSIHYTGYFIKTIYLNRNSSAVEVRLLSKSPETETVTVTSTRSNSRIDDTPTKTEVLGQDDMDEENGIKPGNVSSLLGDLSSIQMQTTSAVSGQTTVRIQGLDGRYTQILRDGLPVYDGFAGGFGFLQLPPLDLKQIELIKGPASTLYGGGAISGLINFVSRTPTDSATHSLTLNGSTLHEANLNFWSSNQVAPKFGYTFLGAANYGQAIDVNKDGFTDVPWLNSAILHPRFFYTPDKNHSFILGFDAALEQRQGGDDTVLKFHADTLHRYFENNNVKRITTELFYHAQLHDSTFFDVKGSSTIYERQIKTENGEFNGIQSVNYLEISWFRPHRKYDLVYGINFLLSRFDQQSPVRSEAIRINQHTNGIFLQHTWRPAKHFTMESGLRGDLIRNDAGYNSFLLPRVALLWKWNDLAGMRMCGGLGYKAINPLTLMPDEHYLPGVSFYSTRQIRNEQSKGGTIDIYYRRKVSSNYSLYLNQSFFITEVNHPVSGIITGTNDVIFHNEIKPLQAYGFDSYVRLSGEELELYLGYTWTNALRTYDEAHPHIPVTPTQRISTVALYEMENGLRIGIESSWIGKQYREDGSATPSYLIMAAMINYNWKNFSFVLNGENLLNILQSKTETLYTRPISSPSFNELWAPVDGRNINFSVRWKW
jgi:outer membrane receptor for ferrienterochelin and colicins